MVRPLDDECEVADQSQAGQLFEQTESSPGVLTGRLDDHEGAQKPVGVAVRSTNYS
jgi:hypothetical protein